jgi:spore germination cell wall hydrolase CwlJ-like protein
MTRNAHSQTAVGSPGQTSAQGEWRMPLTRMEFRDPKPRILWHPKWTKGRFRWVLGLAIALTAPCGAASFDERLVAAVLMAEAGGEGIVGMTAVGEVIANRARKRQMSPGLVVREAYQFSPMTRAKPHQLVSRYQKLPLYRQALRIANTVIQTPAALPGLTAGADHFEDIRAPIPRWARGRRPVAVVGGHRFWLLSN